MSREPFDDRDRRVQEFWDRRDGEIERDHARKQRERQAELDRLRSGEALAARYGLADPAPVQHHPSTPPKQYRRYAFEKAKAEYVAKHLNSFATQTSYDEFTEPKADNFGNYMRYMLELVDRHLPPSDAKEAIYAALLRIEYGHPLTNADELKALATRIRRLGV